MSPLSFYALMLDLLLDMLLLLLLLLMKMHKIPLAMRHGKTVVVLLNFLLTLLVNGESLPLFLLLLHLLLALLDRQTMMLVLFLALLRSDHLLMNLLLTLKHPMFVLLLFPRLLHGETRMLDVHVLFPLLRETMLLLLEILLTLLLLLMLLHRETMLQLLQFFLPMHTVLLLALKMNEIALPIAVALMMRCRGRDRQPMLGLHSYTMLLLQPYLLLAKRAGPVVATVGGHQAIRHRFAETLMATAAGRSRMAMRMRHRKTGLLHRHVHQTRKRLQARWRWRVMHLLLRIVPLNDTLSRLSVRLRRGWGAGIIEG